MMRIYQLLSPPTIAAAILLAPQLVTAQSAHSNQPAPAAQAPATQGGAYTRSDTTGRPAVPSSTVDYTKPMERLFQAAQRLREAVQAMAQQPAGERRNQAMAGAREALLQVQQAMVQLPPELRTQQNYGDAQARLGETQKALQGDQADTQKAQAAVDAYLVLVPKLQPSVAAVSMAGVPLQRVSGLIGTDLIGPSGDKVAEIENFLVDRNSQVRAVVAEWGGFLGIGDHEALVPIDRIRLGAADGDRARTSLTREQLEKSPPFDRDRLADYGREHGWGDGLRWYR